MALSAEMDASLLVKAWKSLKVGECAFLCKVSFTDSAYCLLLSDLSSVWCEEARADVIQERSQELNKRLKAPISSFLSHLSRLFLPLLDAPDTGPNGFSCQRMKGTLMIHVKSQLFGLPFYWEFQCKEATVSTVCRHLVRPLISMTKALDGQRQELCSMLLRKDAEIQDYQESGAALTRDRLKTEAFDEASFQESFLTENIQELSRSGNTPRFSDQLQRLYNCVTAAEIKHNADTEGVVEPLPDVPLGASEKGSSSAGEEPSTAQPSTNTENQPDPSRVPRAPILSLTQRSEMTVTKAKKRKAKGLFT